MGCNAGIPVGNVTTRPTYVVNDLFTYIRGNHTWKAGFEYRNIGGNIHANGNEAGTFNFGRGATGLARRSQRKPHRQLPPGRGGQRQRGLIGR